jgi:hypothetical protein
MSTRPKARLAGAGSRDQIIDFAMEKGGRRAKITGELRRILR